MQNVLTRKTLTLRARVPLEKAPGSEEIIIPSFFFPFSFFFFKNQGIFLSISISKQHRPQMRFQSYQGRLVKGGFCSSWNRLSPVANVWDIVWIDLLLGVYIFCCCCCCSERVNEAGLLNSVSFALRPAILDTCFSAGETMKVFRQMSRRVSLSLSQCKPLFIRAFSLSTHTHTLTGTHTAPSPGSSALWISALSLCVFNYAPSDRPLLRICRFLSPRL